MPRASTVRCSSTSCVGVERPTLDPAHRVEPGAGHVRVVAVGDRFRDRDRRGPQGARSPGTRVPCRAPSAAARRAAAGGRRSVRPDWSSTRYVKFEWPPASFVHRSGRARPSTCVGQPGRHRWQRRTRPAPASRRRYRTRPASAGGPGRCRWPMWLAAATFRLMLRSSNQYRTALQDGREVYYRGRTHPGRVGGARTPCGRRPRGDRLRPCPRSRQP